jgi:hypothetical protein
MIAAWRMVVPLGALVLAGCSSQNSNWNAYFQMFRQALQDGSRKIDITREEAAAVPYASLGYRLDGGREAILVLATDSNGVQIWTSAAHVVLQTNGGRIVRSVGLPHDREGLVPRAGSALRPLAESLTAPYRSSRLVDSPDSGFYNVALDCLTTARQKQTITILAAAIPVIRVDETCQSRAPQWSFTDSYWLDATSGFVWKSIQHLHPAGSAIEIEILRPPG